MTTKGSISDCVEPSILMLSTRNMRIEAVGVVRLASRLCASMRMTPLAKC